MLGTGGEPRPNIPKIKVRFSRDRIGGEALQCPNAPPTAMSGIGGEPRPGMSKVEGPVLLDRMRGEALQRPNAPPQPCQEQEVLLILT